MTILHYLSIKFDVGLAVTRDLTCNIKYRNYYLLNFNNDLISTLSSKVTNIDLSI